MTSKSMIRLADAIKAHNKLGPAETFRSTHLYALCNWMTKENPKFNVDRWIGYLRGKCGPQGGKRKSPAKRWDGDR